MIKSNGETVDTNNTFDHVITVAAERDKKEFFRSALLFLTELPTTPTDVTKAKFGKVTEGVAEVVSCSAHVRLMYSASIGYDREEYYTTREKQYVNGQYRMVEVEKKRTVTDWQPYSGTIEDHVVTALFNGGLGALSKYGDVWDFRLMQVLDSIDDDSMSFDQESAKVAPTTVGEAKKVCAERLEQEITYPGDHVKDKVIRPTVEMQGMTCYKIPYYEVEFEYEGGTYQVFGFAAGDDLMLGIVPKVNTSLQQTVKKAKIISSVTIAATYIVTVSFALISLVSCILYFYDLGLTLSLIGLPFAIAEPVFLTLYKKKVQNDLTNCGEKIGVEKVNELVATLSSFGLDPLSQEEHASIVEYFARHMVEDEETWYEGLPYFWWHTLLWIGLSIPYACMVALWVSFIFGFLIGVEKLINLSIAKQSEA